MGLCMQCRGLPKAVSRHDLGRPRASKAPVPPINRTIRGGPHAHLLRLAARLSAGGAYCPRLAHGTGGVGVGACTNRGSPRRVQRALRECRHLHTQVAGVLCASLLISMLSACKAAGRSRLCMPVWQPAVLPSVAAPGAAAAAAARRAAAHWAGRRRWGWWARPAAAARAAATRSRPSSPQSPEDKCSREQPWGIQHRL